MPAAALERNPAHLGELIDAGASAVAAEAAPANPTERHVRLVIDRAVVDMRHAGIEAPRDRETAFLVRVMMPAESPYSESFAIAMASSTLPTVITGAIGPNVSSRMTFMSRVMFVSTV